MRNPPGAAIQGGVQRSCVSDRPLKRLEQIGELATQQLDPERTKRNSRLMPTAEFILVDISNSFTKIAFASRHRLGRVSRLPTKQLTWKKLKDVLRRRQAKHAIVASVVPSRSPVVSRIFSGPICWVSHKIALGVGIDYPRPETIGADRLANATAATALYGSPAVVVDFGTAVTFDVISADRKYIGGVIAPGLNAMTDYLHKRTALLPRVTLREPRCAVGRSTAEAMRSGAVYGYRGLVAEILRQVVKEIASTRSPHLIATGGDAELIAGKTDLFSAIAPTLTLEGLRLIGCRNFPE